MSTSAPETEGKKSLPLLDLPRLGLVGIAAAVILLGLYWGADFANTHGYDSSLFGYGFLLVVPFVAALLLAALVRVYWIDGGNRTDLVAAIVSITLVIVVLGLAIASPLIICLTMVAPYWLIGGIAGGFASRWVVKRQPHLQALILVSLFAATGGLLVLEPRVGYPTDSYVVSRSVVIAAKAQDVWPHLLRLDNVQSSEQKWTFSQDILAVPRPTEAIVHGAGVGAVRTARWQRDVWFEEHVTGWEPNRSLEWTFVFPEGSTFTGIDQHIDPRGPNLIIQTGGYSLVPLGDRSIRLDLHTTYTASTAVNGYSSLWGELILGDIQTNILSIVKRRAEQPGQQPGDDARSLIAAN